MADVTRRLHLRHLRGTPTSWVSHTVGGKTQKQGTGLSFWYRPLTAVLSEVPVDDRELPLLFHARTEDFADVTVQATVTYRFSDPGAAAGRLDFSIDPYRGSWRGQPLDQVADAAGRAGPAAGARPAGPAAAGRGADHRHRAGTAGRSRTRSRTTRG